MEYEGKIRGLFTFQLNQDSPKAKVWLDFPVTKESIAETLEQAELPDVNEILSQNKFTIHEFVSPVSVLNDVEFLRQFDIDLSELNYLTAVLSQIRGDDFDKLDAMIESGRHQGVNGVGCGNLADIINLAENIDAFDFLNCHDEQSYGEYLLSERNGVIDKIKRHLESSSGSAGWEYANIVEYLRECADAEEFGRVMVQEVDGEFIYDGFLIEEGTFRYDYNGLDDIPNDCRLFNKAEPPAKSLYMVQNTDLSAFLLKMHAVCGDYMRDAKYNISTIAGGANDFFVLDNGGMLVVSSAESLYLTDTFEHKHWLSLTNSPDFKAYYLTVTNRTDGQVTGSIYEAELPRIQESIQKYSISFTHVDAETKDGTPLVFSNEKWNAMDAADREKLKNWVLQYDSDDKEQISTLIGTMQPVFDQLREPMDEGAFLYKINEPYMDAAFHNAIGFVRVSPDAARELLAQNAVEVCRLTFDGAEKMLPIEAVKIGLRQASDREFAVEISDMDGLEKWAQKSAKDIVRQTERGEQKKSKDETL